MPFINKRIESIANLGEWLHVELKKLENENNTELSLIIDKASFENGWFTRESVIQSLSAITVWLQKDVLNNWAQKYFLTEPPQPKTIAVIMAGNIPIVNFHDFLSVLITGHRFLGKLSSKDSVLLPFLAKKLCSRDSSWNDYIQFTEGMLPQFDAVIATGSNNSARYFKYYFDKYPHIIRKNRSSMAVLNGLENTEDIKNLYKDVFQYYGLGCRNVSMLWVPVGYEFSNLFNVWESLPDPSLNNKYKNNYDYYRSIYLINSQPYLDNGFVSMLKSNTLLSPVSVVNYVEYKDVVEVQAFIKTNEKEIQCIIAKNNLISANTINLGMSQSPSILDYPDGIDVVQFLLAL